MFVINHLQATPKLEDQENDAKSTSSFPEVKIWKTSKHLEEVIPANRSSLQDSKRISSLDLFHGKSLQIPGGKSALLGSTTINLMDNTLSDQNSSKDTLTPCSLRKRKLLPYLEKDKMLTLGNNHQDPIGVKYVQSERHVSVKLGEDENHSWSQRNAQVGSVLMSRNDGHVHKNNLNNLDRKDKKVHLIQDASDGDEARGSAFLSQV